MKSQGASYASKLKISDAFIELMHTRDFNTISITDIVKEANISRATFYRHFDTKEAVVCFYFDRLAERYKIFDFLSVKTVGEYYEFVKYVFDTVKKNKRILKIIIGADSGAMVLRYIDGKYTSCYREAKIEKIPMSVYIFSGGIYNVLLKWLEEDCATPSDELAKTVISVTPYEYIHSKMLENANKG